ncbi:Myb-like_DNA-binding domain-containing protein [Hexamita inflata]|uniref:Myb-like DNA-binding domain-containing protein n=1 Tax=Hexamita inflata TaxID=28002 RepID=A0AA86N706_9EUKA|nr:Myb-like DNA-binding domain-containing protein [Hexamita inflata]CAI9950116.1 Myb-like DNA-binding domain-containing protein [Hexamita inflata]
MTQSKYNFWSEEEQAQLLKAICKQLHKKQDIDWQEVEVLMNGRTKQQCKSYYQLYIGKQKEYIQQISNKHNSQFSKLMYIMIFTEQFNYHWAFIQMHFFPDLTVQQIRNLYEQSHKYHYFILQILKTMKNRQNICSQYSKLLLQNIYNDIAQINNYIEVYNQLITKKLEREQVPSSLFNDAPESKEYQLDYCMLVGNFYYEYCTGFDLSQCLLVLGNQLSQYYVK